MLFAIIENSNNKPILKEAFGQTKEGKSVEIYTLENSCGMKARITNYGGIVVSLTAPDKNGNMADVALGCDNLNGYIESSPYFGCIVGRYGNRIGNAKFTLNGQEYILAKNDGENNLHGGDVGFNKAIWEAKPVDENLEGPALELTYLSKDGEEGFPGNLNVKVIYTLTHKNELKIDYFAATDKDTVVNLTHHSYFNLAGQGEGDVLGHEATINADKFTPVDEGSIPTGEIRDVEGTPFDFRTAKTFGKDVNADDEQLKFVGGYDHNWVLNQEEPGKMVLATSAYEPNTGRYMEAYTTEPAIQVYIGNFLDGTITGKEGKVYKRRYGFCMEPQHYPDTPNKPDFPSCVLKPGKEYKTTTIYKFSTK